MGPGRLAARNKEPALPLSVEGRTGQLTLNRGRQASDSPSITRVQRSGQGWEGTGHCYSHWADPGGGWIPGTLLTQLGWIGIGWTRAIVSMSRLQFHLCTYFWLPRQAPKRGRAGSNSSNCFLPMGPESTFLGSG